MDISFKKLEAARQGAREENEYKSLTPGRCPIGRDRVKSGRELKGGLLWSQQQKSREHEVLSEVNDSLGLIWGFIAIQRIVIAIIMPAIQAEMKFTYTDVGLIISITGLIWAFGTIIWASIGDTYGRRPVIVGCAILASVFSWMTGFVHSLGSMLWVRGILGFSKRRPLGSGRCYGRRGGA